MNWKRRIVVPAVFAAFAMPAYAQTQERSNAEGDAALEANRDALILGFLHHANQREIEMANLAKDNSSSRQVKDFADRIIKDHRSAEDQIQALAKKRNLDLEVARKRMAEAKETLEEERRSKAVGSATGEWAFMAEPRMVQEAAQFMTDYKASLEKLRTLKGADFDRQFVRVMQKDHQMVIDRATRARTRVNDPEVTGLVDKLLPTLKEHLSMAQKLQDSLPKA